MQYLGLIKRMAAQLMAATAITSRPFSPRFDSPAVPRQGTGSGAGARRAAARLRAKQRANLSIPSGERMTRQRRRAEHRAWVKKNRVTGAEHARWKMKAIRQTRRKAKEAA